MISEIEKYLKENIDDHIGIIPYENLGAIPVFLRNVYTFNVLTILGTPCMLLEVLGEAPKIDVVLNQVMRIEELTNKKVVLFFKEISRYRRKSLIDKRIPFVVENGQMYLPFVFLDMKRGSEETSSDLRAFTASAQLTYLHFLYHRDAKLNATELAKIMKFTNMTASRALNDLFNANLIRYEIGGKTGRSKKFHRIKDPDYFNKGKAFLKTPVKKTMYLDHIPEGSLIAGLEALSVYSTLNPPDHPVRAMSEDQFKTLKLNTTRHKDIIKDNKYVELEIWSYDPIIYSKNDYVDFLSLYASLSVMNDERVEQAIMVALKDEKWYMA